MPEALLAIRLRALGDVVLTIPALRALRRGHPGARLEVVTERRYAPLLEGLEFVDRVWPLERTTASTLGLAAALRRRRWSVAVDFFGNARSALLTRASEAALRVGWDARGRRRAYHLRVPRSIDPAGREYAAAAYRRLALAAGGIEDGLETTLALPAAARAEAVPLLAKSGVPDAGATVGLVAAGTWSTKSWPLSHCAALARGLLAAGWPVLLLAGPGEETVSRRLLELAPGVGLLPPCDVVSLAAVIERLAAVVGTDSGPRHLAAALAVPSWTWFGPTHPGNWLPPGERHGAWWTDLPCRGCDRTACPHWSCLPSLAPEDALARVLDHLERHARPAAALGSAARA